MCLFEFTLYPNFASLILLPSQKGGGGGGGPTITRRMQPFIMFTLTTWTSGWYSLSEDNKDNT